MWCKTRGSASGHKLTDVLRGVTKGLASDSNDEETTDATGLTAFGADGFTVGSGVNYSDTTGDGMVAWCWKAGGSGSSNEDGSINTTATSANVTAGFSISTYTGNGTGGATVGHGLSKAPNLVIIKNRSDAGTGWPIGSIQPIGSMDFTDYLDLNGVIAVTDEAALFHDTAPTSSVVTISTGYWVNTNTKNYVMYCWHNVEGFSKIGSYVANGNADGPFVYTGFRPKFLMFQAMSTTANWAMIDTAREPYNPSIKEGPYAETTAAESGTTYYKDILSNGFKLRNTGGGFNSSTNTYIYFAFAEHPFKYTTAR